MRQVNIHEAKTQLSRLVQEAHEGEEIVIARAGTPLARLVPLTVREAPRPIGLYDGQPFTIAEDFDTLPDDIADAFGALTR